MDHVFPGGASCRQHALDILEGQFDLVLQPFRKLQIVGPAALSRGLVPVADLHGLRIAELLVEHLAVARGDEEFWFVHMIFLSVSEVTPA